MTALNKQALRGQSVEGSYYLAECGHCGEMYPSNKLSGGEQLFSGDYGECFCHLCGADDTDIADYGAWGSEAVTAWNYQQKRIEALLDELEVISKSEWKLAGDLTEAQMNNTVLEKKLEAAEKRIAEHNFENQLLANADRDIKALRQHIAELEAKLEIADKLQDSAFRHGLQHGFSYGQTNDQAGYEQCLKSYSAGGKNNG